MRHHSRCLSLLSIMKHSSSSIVTLQKARLDHNILDWQRLQVCHHMLGCQTQEPPQAESVIFLLEQLQLLCGRSSDWLHTSDRDSVLLLLSLVQMSYSKNKWTRGTHGATKLTQAVCLSLVSVSADVCSSYLLLWVLSPSYSYVVRHWRISFEMCNTLTRRL